MRKSRGHALYFDALYIHEHCGTNDSKADVHVMQMYVCVCTFVDCGWGYLGDSWPIGSLRRFARRVEVDFFFLSMQLAHETVF